MELEDLLKVILDDFARDLKEVHEPDAYDKYMRYRDAALLKLKAVMPK